MGSPPPSKPGLRRSRSTWSSAAGSTSRASSRWRPGRARSARSCGSSSTWTWGTRTAGDSTRSFRPSELIDATPGRVARRAGRGRLPRRGRGSLALLSTAHGEFGVISSVTQPFCADCTRARLSAEGKLYTCLFAVEGRDLRAHLRDGSDDEALEAFIREVWSVRTDRYSELRSAATSKLPKVEMFAMGG